MNYSELFKPNGRPDRAAYGMMIIAQLIIASLIWFFSQSPLLPTPIEIGQAFGRLVREENLIQELWTSMSLSLEAMAYATLFSLLIAYATVIPFFRPLAFLVSKFRFLTLVGLSFVFTLLTHSGHSLKVWLLVFGITVFFVTSMVGVVQTVSRNELNHARTLRMTEWQVVWEVIILGRFDVVFEVIRQNFAIAWALLTLVEGISRSEGGVGTLLLNQNKHFHLDAVFAIQLAILLVGIALDYGLGFLKRLFCPYASLTLDQR
ncbi:ABC transporter permease [uncultured Fibrella sp.]|uniref:ABC transporter permease n=1 Tax=uncultured Fibrella sp. TaxID=1284596 RepID=UPI0035CC11E5